MTNYQIKYEDVDKLRLLEDGELTTGRRLILTEQEGVCAICGLTATVADHDHVTGFVRGILCGPCNTGLGMFKDSPQLLENAVQYLRESREETRELIEKMPDHGNPVGRPPKPRRDVTLTEDEKRLPRGQRKIVKLQKLLGIGQ